MVTPSQQKIYAFIKQFIEEKNYSPSYDEIARGIGFQSKGSIHRHVQALAEAALLQVNPGKRRQIQLAPTSRFAIPLYGQIAAGVPIEAISESETIDVVDLLASVHRVGQYALKVKGDSMIDEGILDGDIILCESQNTAQNGEIVVALIDMHEATLKRIHFNKDGKITLMPANSNLKPRIYDAKRISIQGIFIGLLRINKKP